MKFSLTLPFTSDHLRGPSRHQASGRRHRVSYVGGSKQWLPGVTELRPGIGGALEAPALTMMSAQGAPQRGRPGAAADEGGASVYCTTHPARASWRPQPRPGVRPCPAPVVIGGGCVGRAAGRRLWAQMVLIACCLSSVGKTNEPGQWALFYLVFIFDLSSFA